MYKLMFCTFIKDVVLELIERPSHIIVSGRIAPTALGIRQEVKQIMVDVFCLTF